jgi:hypothetical protein
VLWVYSRFIAGTLVVEHHEIVLVVLAGDIEQGSIGDLSRREGDFFQLLETQVDVVTATTGVEDQVVVGGDGLGIAWLFNTSPLTT